MVLLCPITLKKVVVGKRLQAGRLANRKTTALCRVGVNEVVPILCNVAGNCCRWQVVQLHPEAVLEFAGGPIRVVGRESIEAKVCVTFR